MPGNNTYRERVHNALSDQPVKACDLAKQLGYSSSTVGQALRDLIADGKATKTRRGFSLRTKVRFF